MSAKVVQKKWLRKMMQKKTPPRSTTKIQKNGHNYVTEKFDEMTLFRARNVSQRMHVGMSLSGIAEDKCMRSQPGDTGRQERQMSQGVETARIVHAHQTLPLKHMPLACGRPLLNSSRLCRDAKFFLL